LEKAESVRGGYVLHVEVVSLVFCKKDFINLRIYEIDLNKKMHTTIFALLDHSKLSLYNFDKKSFPTAIRKIKQIS